MLSLSCAGVVHIQTYLTSNTILAKVVCSSSTEARRSRLTFDQIHFSFCSMHIDQGDDIDGRRTNSGNTCLHVASSRGKLKVVKKFLLQSGADSDAKDSAGDTPLHLASVNGQTRSVWFLVEEKGVPTFLPKITVTRHHFTMRAQAELWC
jgi:hypothetical protein